MPKVRYEVATGKVNLISTGEDELPVQGCQYLRVATYPQFDHQNENLFVRNGKVVAVSEYQGKEHVRQVP